MSAWELFIVVFRCYRVRPIVVQQFFERLWRRDGMDRPKTPVVLESVTIDRIA